MITLECRGVTLAGLGIWNVTCAYALPSVRDRVALFPEDLGRRRVELKACKGLEENGAGPSSRTALAIFGQNLFASEVGVSPVMAAPGLLLT